MSSQKLSEEDKSELVRLYRDADETTATLAHRFQVSSSTVSRVLRTSLSSEEYDRLIQQKRHLRQQNRFQQENEELSRSDAYDEPTASESNMTPEQSESHKKEQLEVSVSDENTSSTPSIQDQDNLEQVDFSMIHAMFGEDVGEDEDLEDSDDEDWEEENVSSDRAQQKQSSEIEVLPLSQAKFPKTCYLVIDRGANLITKPLKEFSDLGSIPSMETQQKTLPIFDNHRVARRFSNRSQKVIKVPDGKMIKKTREYLEAKGIKRILMDGKVYKIS